MATNPVDMLEYVESWHSALNKVNSSSNIDLTASAIEDLKALIALNQTAIEYLKKLKNSENPILKVQYERAQSFHSEKTVERHFDFLYTQLVVLSRLEASDTLASLQREALLFKLAKIFAISLMSGMGAYFFWLMPIQFVCGFALMAALTCVLFLGKPEFLPFLMLDIFFASFDVFSVVNNTNSLRAFLLAILSSPYLPWAILPFVALAAGYAVNKLYSNGTRLEEYEEAVQVIGANPKQEFINIKNNPRMQFFQNHKVLCDKVDAAYQATFKP